jgi:tRNA dimethylallyltransferase
MADSARLPPLVCLLGPTASGKTALAVALAEVLDCELISVDSALVYRGMDIGSAKPDYPHHLIDICDPAECYSAASFATDARRLIAEITARGRTPLLVGGTMLYFRALLSGLSPMPPANPEIRAEIEREAAGLGWPAIHRQLAEVDPEAAGRIHPNHSQRLARALEIFRSTGVAMTRWQHADPLEPPMADRYAITQLAVCPAERAVLHARIRQRFHGMMAAGFLDEVRTLHARGDLGEDLPAIRAVGYRQLWQHLEGRCSLESAVDSAIVATRQLAKRQLTWLRKWPDLQWILTDPEGGLAAGETATDPAAAKAHRIAADPEEKNVETVLNRALRYLGAGPM